MKKWLRRILKSIGYFLLGIIALLLILMLLIQVPAVQNWVVGKVTNTLEERLGTEVDIAHVDIDFIKKISIEGIYIEDQKQDTLLYLDDLVVDIGLFSLFGQEIVFDIAKLEGGVIKLDRQAGDSTFNYQFVIDAFASSDTTTQDTSGSAWTVDIGDIVIDNVRFRMYDGEAATDLEANIGNFHADFKTFNLSDQDVAFDKIELADSGIRFTLLVPDTLNQLPKPPPDPNAPAMPFPELGWSLRVDEIILDNTYFGYLDQNAERLPNQFDYGDINLQSLDMVATDFVWEGKHITTSLTRLDAVEKSGLTLESFTADLTMDSNHVAIENAELLTPTSKINTTTRLRYDQFSDLLDFMNGVTIDANIPESYITVEDLKYFAPQVDQIQQIKLRDSKRIYFSGAVGGKVGNLNISDLVLRSPEVATLRASAQLRGLPDPDALRFKLNLKELSTSYNQLNRILVGVPLPEGLKDFGRFRLSADAQGAVSDFRMSSLRLRTDAYTSFTGSGRITGLPDPDALHLDLNVQELKTRADDLRGFAEIPPQVDSLGSIQFAGDFKGSLQDFNIDGQLSTDIGSLDADMDLAFNADYTDASYKGDLKLNQFEVGVLAGDPTLGPVTLTATVDGSGLTPETINTVIDANVDEFSYNGYTYNNLKVDGALDGMDFKGSASIDDPNLQFAFDGEADLNGELPDLQFTMSIDSLNLQQLGFVPDALSIKGDITANLRGNSVDNIDGRVVISDFRLTRDTLSWLADTMTLRAEDLADGNGKGIYFDSDILTAELEGQYSLVDLPVLLTNFFNDFFPVDELVSPVDEPAELAIEPQPAQQPAVDQSFTYEINVYNPIPLTKLFVPALEELDSANVAGRFDSKDKILQTYGLVPRVVYAGTEVDSIILDMGGDAQLFNTQLMVQTINAAGGALRVPLTMVNMSLGNDSLFVNLDIAGDTLYRRLSLGGIMAQNQRGVYRFSLAEQIIITDDTWTIPRDNRILYNGSDFLNIKNLRLTKDEQSLFIRSSDDRDPGIAPIALGFDNFKLSTISRIVGLKDVFYEGTINGEAVVNGLQENNLSYTADLAINDILLNDAPVGDLTIKADQAPGSQVIDVDVALRGTNNDATITGAYNIADTRFDLDANLQRLELRIIDAFTLGAIRDSEGFISGDFDITGTPDQPSVDGSLTFNNATTTIDYLGVRYQIPQHTVQVSDQLVRIGNMTLRDTSGLTSTLSGEVRHDFFTNIELDLRYQTDNFPILNTTEEGENQLFYGKVYVAANVRITGTADLPIIDVNARTMPNTKVFVQPLEAPTGGGAGREDWIIYADPANYTADSIAALLEQRSQSAIPIDLTLNLQVTPEAELQIIVNPLTDDKLTTFGSANMTVQMSPDGEVSVTGDYTIERGNYNFNFQDLFRRNFTIEEGSRLTFVGDPLKTRFDITAVYTTRTTTYELIRNEATLDAREEAAAKQRVPIDVLLQMRGDLNSPELTFDLRLPEEQSGLINSTVARKVSNLRDNPNEMNKQVVGLILFNSFIVADQSSTGFDAGQAGKNAAVSSLTNLVSSQLNQLADRFVKGVDLSIGLESYRNDYLNDGAGGTTTELQVGLQKQLFSDRVTVKVGGSTNLNASNSNALVGDDFTAFAGEFVLEFKLTESGNYRLQVFTRSDYDAFEAENDYRSGVGFFFTKSFDGIEFKKRKAQLDEVPTQEDEKMPEEPLQGGEGIKEDEEG